MASGTSTAAILFKAPANNIVTGGRLTPLVDISNVPDKYKDVVNSKELLTPNDFMAAFVYTALKNRDLNQKFKGMFDNLRKEDSESHVAPGSDMDYIGTFAGQALEYAIKTKSTAVACKSPRAESSGDSVHLSVSSKFFN